MRAARSTPRTRSPPTSRRPDSTSASRRPPSTPRRSAHRSTACRTSTCCRCCSCPASRTVPRRQTQSVAAQTALTARAPRCRAGAEGRCGCRRPGAARGRSGRGRCSQPPNTPAGAQGRRSSDRGRRVRVGQTTSSRASQSLWNRESGWNYQAYNAGSGATGIPQALPGSKMASVGSRLADQRSDADPLGPEATSPARTDRRAPRGVTRSRPNWY